MCHPARGLDIPHIKTVVNYDVARDIDTHTHRVGRTGRAGTKGHAYTLITKKDKEFAPLLVRNLEGANQHVPPGLLNLAEEVGNTILHMGLIYQVGVWTLDSYLLLIFVCLLLDSYLLLMNLYCDHMLCGDNFLL